MEIIIEEIKGAYHGISYCVKFENKWQDKHQKATITCTKGNDEVTFSTYYKPGEGIKNKIENDLYKIASAMGWSI